MIPKIIHYCWFGSAKQGKLERKCIEGWKRKLPEYELIEWNEKNFDINQYAFAREAYERKKYAFVADVCRLKALQQYGGIYLDTDVQVVRSFDDLLSLADVIFGMEDNEVISTACILAKKGSRVIDELLSYYESACFIGTDGLLDLTPNTQIISRLLQLEGDQMAGQQITGTNIRILPRDFFSPKDFMTQKVTVTENTYCIHLFSGSWISNYTKFKEAIIRLLPSRFYHWYRILKLKIYG